MGQSQTVMGRRQSLLLLVASALAACTPRPAAGPLPIDLFAAASLREVLDALASDFMKHTGRTVRITYAGSAQLARQIDQGAPADLFISADEDWMDWLAERNRILPETRRRIAGNRLVLIAPASTSEAQVDLTSATSLKARLGGGRLAIADASVPAGRYAQQALTRLNLWPDVIDHLAPGDSVRAALALVAHGQAPLGVVYATDARAEPGVRMVASFPANSHAPIIYPAARLQRRSGDGDPVSTQVFLDLLSNAEGQAVFQRFGFTRPPS